MEWKKFRDFDYLVSDDGLVKRIKTGKIIKQHENYGYKIVCLSNNGKHYYFRVHRIIGELFLPITGKVINHKNGIRNDNRLENLEWCTQSYNVKHSYDILNRTRIKSDVNSVYMYDTDYTFIKEYKSLSECSKKTGFSKGNISQCCNKKGYRKTVNGYIFEYGIVNRFKKKNYVNNRASSG